MNELLEPLYALHLLDDRIHRARQGLAALDQPSPLEQQLKRVDEELARHEAVYRKAHADLQDAELQLRTTEAKRDEDKKRLYGGQIVATRDLQALEHEIENLNQAISQGEDRVLAAMEKIEPITVMLKKLREAKKAGDEQLAAQRALQETERRRLNADLAQTEPLRPKAVEAVDPALLQRYEKVRISRKHPGMALVMNGSCGFCHTTIPVMAMRRLRAGDTILQCDNCTRIYYLPPAPLNE